MRVELHSDHHSKYDCYHTTLITVPPSLYHHHYHHHYTTITIPPSLPPSLYTTITIPPSLPPSLYHHHYTTITTTITIPPSLYHHHYTTITIPPSLYHHHYTTRPHTSQSLPSSTHAFFQVCVSTVTHVAHDCAVPKVVETPPHHYQKQGARGGVSLPVPVKCEDCLFLNI